MKTIRIEVDDDIYRQLADLAAKGGDTLESYLLELIDEGLHERGDDLDTEAGRSDGSSGITI